jgi:superfamily II DNA or RNA helicase
MGIKLIIQDEVNIKFEGLPVDVRRKLANSLKFFLPHARHMPQYKLGRWDGTVGFFGLGGDGYLNHLDVLLPILEKEGLQIDEIEDRRLSVDLKFQPIEEDFWGDKTWPKGHRFEGQPIRLRDDQVEVVNRFLENPQSLQEVSTGAGKTITTATLSKICEPYGRTIVIVPNKSLVEQTEEDYINCGLDVGVYYGDRKELNRTHTICTWQSLNVLDKKSKGELEHPSIRLIKNINNITLDEFLEGVSAVIVDEVHQAKADVLKAILTKNLKNCPIRWGLTGTIPKADHEFQSILASLGPVIGQVTAKELQDKGILASCEVNIQQLIDTQEFRDYQSELKFLTTNEDRLKHIANAIGAIRQSGNTLVLVDRIASGEKLEELISDSTFVNGSMKTKNRKAEYKDINEGHGKVLIATYGVAAVGINIPRIFNLVLIEPGKSFVRVIQSIGRGIRKANDKDFVQIWDVTSTCKYAKRHLRERKKFYDEAGYPYVIEKIDWN